MVADAAISRDTVHFCKHCTRPILRYGWLLPSSHVFCHECANAMKSCGEGYCSWPDCDEITRRVDMYGNFDIILDHFPRSFKLETLHAPCVVIYLVCVLIVC